MRGMFRSNVALPALPKRIASKADVKQALQRREINGGRVVNPRVKG